ncbi:MAG: SIS domain-containing protein [Rubrobacteraceae bacterium]
MKSKMLEEIQEQPEVLERILEDGWPEVLKVARSLREENPRFVMLAARGTSDNAALYAKYLFEIVLGIPTALASPSVFTLYESEIRLDDVLVIGISQSGESKDVLETVRQSRTLGASTISVTNDANFSMSAAADYHLSLHAGKEESVAATKTYTASLLLLYLLVEALRGEDAPSPDARKLPEGASATLSSGWEETARYRYADHMVVTSRGFNLPTAQEAALKLMETSYIVAQPFSEADLRHGPMAMVTRDFPVLAIVPPGRAHSTMIDVVETLDGRGAELLVVNEAKGPLKKAAAGFRVPVSCPEELSPILYAIPPQMLAHDLCILKGLDPDSPRGLSKVTESW